MREGLQKSLLPLQRITHPQRSQTPSKHVGGPVAPSMVAKVIFGFVHAAFQQFQPACAVSLFAGKQTLRFPEHQVQLAVFLLTGSNLPQYFHLGHKFPNIAAAPSPKRTHPSRLRFVAFAHGCNHFLGQRRIMAHHGQPKPRKLVIKIGIAGLLQNPSGCFKPAVMG